jgi:hypothetical protein
MRAPRHYIVMARFWLLPVWGCLVLAGRLPSLSAADAGARAQLVGGTPAGIPAKASVRMDLTDNDTLLLRAGKLQVRIPYGKVNTLEYGQNVSRRYAAAILISPMLLLSKSHKHFVTLGYVDSDGRQQALVLRVEKGDIRAVLSGLEARTGRRVEYQDDEARKAGKG